MIIDIASILDDNKSGSLTLATNMLMLFKDYLNKNIASEVSPDDLFEEIQKAAKAVIKHQTNMVLLRKSGYNFVNFFKRIYTDEISRTELIESLLGKLDSQNEELQTNAENVALNGSKIIANFNKILTYSNSSVVFKLFQKATAQKRKFEVYCLKSDPPGEGLDLAEKLSKMDVKTTIVPDTQAGIVMDEMNIVYVGADRLYENGFVNKSGTLAVCLLAKQFNVPVYLVSETSKILLESERSIKSSERDSKEVYEKENEISVINSYYEKIPYNLVQKVICEEGVFETSDFISWHLGD
ncbi:MAG: hypothetical protein H6627_10600 [Calditrichae bacterium]|nr:hypothetical protein [Calditrichota bacterium]MCB9059007.1 hypothetical protein [Calditrichia bacterium]